jgi:hypothetical protein
MILPLVVDTVSNGIKESIDFNAQVFRWMEDQEQ